MNDKVIVSKSEIEAKLKSLYDNNQITQHAADDIYALLHKEQPAPCTDVNNVYDPKSLLPVGLVSYALDASHCTLNFLGKEMKFIRQPAIPEGYQLVPTWKEYCDQIMEDGSKQIRVHKEKVAELEATIKTLQARVMELEEGLRRIKNIHVDVKHLDRPTDFAVAEATKMALWEANRIASFTLEQSTTTDIDEVIAEFRKDPEMAKALDDVKKVSNNG
jgi:hypothetical protein